MPPAPPAAEHPTVPDRDARVFIAYDFEIGGMLPNNLARVSESPPAGYDVDWPGAPGGLTQGAIWKNIVQPKITQCDRLLAFVDLPNANVGFEVGYGLGLRKMVALARLSPTLAPWLRQPPLHGFLCPLLETPAQVRAQVGSPGENWIQLATAPTGGPGVLVLCPGRTGAAFLEMLPSEWGWRTLPEAGWDLHALPEQLSGVGLVVWVIAPHNEGPSGRDGRENAALSVIAGYAEARGEIELRVVQDANARVVVDVVASRAEFSTPDGFLRRLEALKAEWDAKQAPRAAGATAAPTAPERPKIDPLPPDDWSDMPARFIGRQLQLNDFGEALEGLRHRALTGQPPQGSRAVKVIWVHGFGGMGKSWFLHRARLQAGDDVRALIVDWDSPVWRLPLTGEPKCAADLFETIAHRLVQKCGDPAADPYWTAKERVRTHFDDHRRLRDRFEGQLTLATTPERLDSSTLRMLQNERVWVDDPTKRTRNLDALRRDPDRCQALFVGWCHETARDVDPAVVEPDRLLVDGLRESLRLAAREHPLILLFDTCEVLSADLDRWVRTLLALLCRDETPLLVLIGSRLDPDVAVPAGVREGWQIELPRERFRSVPFNELVRFSVEEIADAVSRTSRPDQRERGALAERLHRVTRGVPLAVRALLDDLAERGRDESFLDELIEGDDDELTDEREAVRRVVGTVARRMLYHLNLDRRPEREDDLRDIVALAILQRADPDVLGQLWTGRRVRNRLRDLGARYALVSGGDLHATVRDYLRRSWRDEAERPPVFDEVLATVEQAVASLPPPTDREGISDSLVRRTLLANLQTWRDGDRAVPELARSLTVALAYEDGTDDLQSLLSELPLAGKSVEDARKLWRKSEADRPDHGRVVAWLRGVRDRSSPWSEREEACLALIDGLATLRREITQIQAPTVLSRLKSAVAHFGAESVPQKRRVGEAFLSIATTLDPSRSHDERFLIETEEGYLLASQLGSNEAFCFNNLGNLFKNHLGRYTDAERAYLKAVELDPKLAYPHNGLGNLYRNHLGRYADAEKAYRMAVVLDPKSASQHNGLGNLYQDHLGLYADAERAYLKAIDVDPKLALPHNGLGNLYTSHLGRYADAERAYLKAVELDPKFASPHNNLGNLYQDHPGRYADAERAYLKAVELDSKLAVAYANLGELYGFHLERYEEAERAYLKALELDPKEGYAYAGLAWLRLHHEGDVARARESAQQAVAADPRSVPGRLANLAVLTWDRGWNDSRLLMPDWLADAPGGFAGHNRWFLTALFRRVRAQGGLTTLAEMLGAVSHRRDWKPWSEAVSALAAGDGPEACTSDEAKSLYEALSSPA